MSICLEVDLNSIYIVLYFVPAYILLIHKYLDEGYSHTLIYLAIYMSTFNLYLFCAKVNNKSIIFFNIIYYFK